MHAASTSLHLIRQSLAPSIVVAAQEISFCSACVGGQAGSAGQGSNASTVAAGLLRFAQSINNFVNVTAIDDTSGWSSDTEDPCTWKFVDCSSNGSAYMSLNLSGVQLTGESCVWLAF